MKHISNIFVISRTDVLLNSENKRTWAIRNKENRNIIEINIIISMYKQTDRNVNQTMSHLFTSFAFVLRTFAGSPLHRNQNFNSWFFSSEGFRPNKDTSRVLSNRLPCWINPGLTSLALMRVVTIPTEQSAIMKVAYWKA